MLHKPGHHRNSGPHFCYGVTELHTQKSLKNRLLVPVHLIFSNGQQTLQGAAAPQHRECSALHSTTSYQGTRKDCWVPQDNLHQDLDSPVQSLRYPTLLKAAKYSSTWRTSELVSFWQGNSQGARCHEHRVIMFTSAEVHSQPLLW